MTPAQAHALTHYNEQLNLARQNKEVTLAHYLREIEDTFATSRSGHLGESMRRHREDSLATTGIGCGTVPTSRGQSRSTISKDDA